MKRSASVSRLALFWCMTFGWDKFFVQPIDFSSKIVWKLDEKTA